MHSSVVGVPAVIKFGVSQSNGCAWKVEPYGIPGKQTVNFGLARALGVSGGERNINVKAEPVQSYSAFEVK